MRCALVFHLVATIFVVVYSAPELCVFRDNFKENGAHCGIDDVSYTIEFIPHIRQNITLIDLMGQPLEQLRYNAFRNVSSQSNLSRIFLDHCQIRHVDAGALLNLHNLTTVSLTFNFITQIDSKLFSDTKQLEHIFMHHNTIAVLPSGLFENLLRLEQVILDHNQIHHVERFSFQNTPSLRIIDLSNNKIKFMNISFKDKFDKLTHLWLSDNPWKCDCELGPLYELLITIRNINQIGLVCENPPTLHGRKWNKISRDTFVCPSEDATSTQGSVVTSTEPVITTEQADNVPVTAYNGRSSARPINARNLDIKLAMRIVRQNMAIRH